MYNPFHLFPCPKTIQNTSKIAAALNFMTEKNYAKFPVTRGP